MSWEQQAVIDDVAVAKQSLVALRDGLAASHNTKENKAALRSALSRLNQAETLILSLELVEK